jgi:hypothetical protein
MKLTAVFEPDKEGGYSCFVEEIPAAISQGETLEEAKAICLMRCNLCWSASANRYEK